MKTKYLSHAQACAICRDYQYLLGESLVEGQTIDLVTLAPYSRILQWQFLHRVLYGGFAPNPLHDKNPSGRYDVLVVSKCDEEPGFITKDIRTYLKEARLPFNEGRYSCLRNPNIPLVTLKQILG
jgi:hypothetical protein